MSNIVFSPLGTSSFIVYSVTLEVLHTKEKNLGVDSMATEILHRRNTITILTFFQQIFMSKILQRSQNKYF